MKAVFVDGAALQFMMFALNIPRLSYKQLKAILLSELGISRRFASRPVITISVRQAEAFGSTLTRMGYDVRPVSSLKGKDDGSLSSRSS